jgi:hypothetical protein
MVLQFRGSTRRVAVVSRSSLGTLIIEQDDAGHFGRLDPATRAEMRRLHGVEGVIHGAIFGSSENPEWIMQLIDSETGEVKWGTQGTGDLAQWSHKDLREELRLLLFRGEWSTYPCKQTVPDTIRVRVR